MTIQEMRASCLAEIAKALYTTSDYLFGFEEKLIFFRFERLTCEILDQPNKDDFVRKYVRKDIKCKLTSFRIGVPDKDEELRNWYDGYFFGNKEIYNPWSVINYLSRGCLPQAYWVNTGKNEVLEDVLKFDG